MKAATAVTQAVANERMTSAALRTRSAARTAAKPERAVSNHAMQHLLRARAIQAKLTVNTPNDQFEQEADRVADQVMRMSNDGVSGSPPSIQRACTSCNKEMEARSIQRMCKECDEEVQRKEGNLSEHEMTSSVESQISALQSGGEPLSAQTRSFFEPRFGRDFSDVRVHADAPAADTAQSINALAYTRGSHIVFGPGQYEPETSAGRRLMAHELTHVVQQAGSDGKGLNTKPASDMVQRACGVGPIGTPAGCTLDATDPAGELVLFRFDCDEYSSLAESAKVVDFADSMAVGDRVRVHGFASNDGDPTYNHNLSCARAQRASIDLQAEGIGAGQIDVLEHGPTPGAAALRRSVVLEMVPAVSRPVVPQLTANIQTGPASGSCGDELFIIQWSLSRNSDATDGGFVIQDVTFNWNLTDCTGAAIPTPPFNTPLRYFEAWRVPPGTNAPNATAFTVDTDRFFWPDNPPWGGGCSDGTVSITATARYHDRVAALPAHMTPFNPNTFANDLPSSTTDPALAGNVSRPVAHSLQFHWNCCPCSTSPTVVDSHVP